MSNSEKSKNSFGDLTDSLKGVTNSIKSVGDSLKDVAGNFDNAKESLVEAKDNISLENVITTAIRIPGVKVDRSVFLREQFKDAPEDLMDLIIEKGPVEAKCPREKLRKIATKLVYRRTVASTGASFLAGLPGGLAMAATIPADMLQFYAVALGLAQELSYLYGEPDFWNNGLPDTERVTNQLILYCGVMLGASGAAQTVRVLSSSLAKQALKKIPQKALTKTFYYPVVKSIAKFFGAKMTKDVFAKGVSKAVPVIGGVVSGGLTFASMKPMGTRLINTLDEAHFEYSEESFDADWNDIMAQYEKGDDETEVIEVEPVDVIDNEAPIDIDEINKEPVADAKSETNDTLEKIAQAKQMLDMGIIDEHEFNEIKAKLIAQM